MLLLFVGAVCGGFCAIVLAVFLYGLHAYHERPQRFPSRQVHPH